MMLITDERLLSAVKESLLRIQLLHYKNEVSEKVAPRCSKYFFDHSKVRFTANPKLAFQAQTLNLQPFRFTKNGY